MNTVSERPGDGYRLIEGTFEQCYKQQVKFSMGNRENSQVLEIMHEKSRDSVDQVCLGNSKEGQYDQTIKR